MNWYDFIFSASPKYRIRRHLVCWLLWWAFIILTVFFTMSPIIPKRGVQPYFVHHQPGLEALGFYTYSVLVLIKSLMLLPVHIFLCYTVIYFLLPNFKRRKKYWELVAGILLACGLTVPMGYILYTMVYPFFDDLFSLHLPGSDKVIVYRSIDASLINAVKATLLGGAVKLLKQWWERQMEKEQLERERIGAELQLLKAQMHPGFLFNTLNNIIAHARIFSPLASVMVIKLSDLLSYMLYECDAPKVKLDKEIAMLREYVDLEKMRRGEKLEVTFQVKGDLNGLEISPLILLPFIEYVFSCTNSACIEQAWINLDITVEGNALLMKLINGTPLGLAGEIEKEEEALANVRKRLLHLYPGSHEFKIYADQELHIAVLRITLGEELCGDQINTLITKPALSYARL